MRVSVLGAPAVVRAADVVPIRGTAQVSAFALLATSHGGWVRRAVLEDQVWGGARVSDSALRVTINRLRAQLQRAGLTDVIEGDRAAYRLAVEPGDIDAHRYARLVEEATATRGFGNLGRAVEVVARADALWRGPAYDGALDLPPVRAEHERLERMRDDVLERAAADLLDLGDAGSAAEVAGRVTDRQPYRESAWALHIAALHQLGRTAEAIAAYERLKAILDEDLGIGPAASVHAVIDAVTRAAGDDLAAALHEVLPGRRSESHRLAAGARPPRGPFVGREAELARLVDGLRVTGGAGNPPWILEGAAGIGKTRLGQEVADTLLGDGWLVLQVGCSRGGGAGLEPVAELVDLLLGAVDPGARHQYSALHVLAPNRFGGPPPFSEPDAELRRLRFHEAAARLLADRVATRTVLVVVDDLHWIEPGGASALTLLQAAVPGVRWLLLARTSDRTAACAGMLADLARLDARWSSLSPLGDDEVRALVGALAGPDAPAWTDLVVARAGGDPLLVTELVRHLHAGGSPESVPAGIAASVAAAMAACPAEVRDVARAVSLADRRVSHRELEAVLGEGVDGGEVVDLHERLVEAGRHGLVALGDGCVEPAHDLVAQALVEGCEPGEAARWHRRWAATCASQGSAAHHRFRHLLAAGDADAPELDAVAGPALRALLTRGAVFVALELAEAYLEAAGPVATTRDGIDGRLQAAAALLSAGQVQRGRALYDLLWPAVSRLEDPVLLADAVLARGAVDTATPDRDREIADSQALLAALPSNEIARRVQLACWCAHHLSGAGDREGAERVLRAAEAELERAPDVSLLGLILGIRCQAASVADAPPEETRDAYDVLADYAALTGEVSAVTIARLFGLDQAMRDGTAADLRAAIDSLEEIRGRFPRPDLRWWPAAARAAMHLSAGTVADAVAAIDEAEAIGNELRLSIAAPIGMSLRLMQRWAAGTLAELRPLFPPITGAATEDRNVTMLLGGALVLLETGDVASAGTVASVLADRAPLLAPEGAGWAVSATLAGEVAFRCSNAPLGAALADEVALHRGVGLSVGGLTHGGAADRVLGQALAAMGDLSGAIEALEAGFELDRSRGWLRWARRAASAAAVVRTRRGEPGDAEAANVLVNEAERLRVELSDVV